MRPGDRLPTDPVTSERSEWSQTPLLVPGSEIWVAGSLLIEPGEQVPSYDYLWCVICQFHHSLPTGSPPFEMIWATGDRIRLNTRGTTSTDQSTFGSILTTTQYETGFTRNVYESWVMRCKFSLGTPTAEFQAWHQGVEVVNATGVTMGYNDTGTFFKYGIYRKASPITQALRWANLEVSTTSSLLARVASPLPIAGT